MAPPKRKKEKPTGKTTAEWEVLNSHEVLAEVFGKPGQKALRKEAGKAAPKRKDYRLP